jgi:hypothetical protein
LTRSQYLAGTVGRQGNRTLGANGERLVLARHVALSLVGRARHRARRFLGRALSMVRLPEVASKLNPLEPSRKPRS